MEKYGYVDWVRNHEQDFLLGSDPELTRRFEDDLRSLKNQLDSYAQHIMLLSLDEAQGIIDDFLGSSAMTRGTTYAGNIRDTVGAAKNLTKLFSYKDAGKIVFTLKGFGIKATQYAYGGKMYVKITGYPSLRRILNGTRYSINHPRVLELGLGRAGIHNGVIEGARFCIWFSVCWRLVELIFKSEHDVAAFLGNITMDMAKVIVTICVSDGIMFVATALTASLAVPIWGQIVVVVAIGIFITNTLDTYDQDHKLSNKLIDCIRDGLKQQQKIEEWNSQHSSLFWGSTLHGFN